MTLQRPTIILFDMDGTTVRHIHPLLLNILERMDDVSYKAAQYFSKVFHRKINPVPLVETRHGKRPKLLGQRALHKIRRKSVDEIVEPCPGIYAVLDYLKSQNIQMALVSNGLGKGYGHDILKTFDLEPYFAVTLFREDLRRAKPHPDPLLQALEALPRRPTKDDVIWTIGDRRKDILAALAAAPHLPCPILPVAYGLNAAMAILERSLPPDHIFMAWSDVEARLKQVMKG